MRESKRLLLPMRLNPRCKRKSLDSGFAGEINRVRIRSEMRTPGEVVVNGVSKIDWRAPMVRFAESNAQSPQSPFHFAGIKHDERLIGRRPPDREWIL